MYRVAVENIYYIEVKWRQVSGLTKRRCSDLTILDYRQKTVKTYGKEFVLSTVLTYIFIT